MKSLKLLLPVCLLMTFILSSCGGGGHKDQILDYLAVKTKKDANKISLLDYEGKIVAEDEFDETSTIIATNGVIYDFNSKTKKLKYWTLSDKKVKPLFDKVFEAGTPFNEDYAVVRDDQGMLSLIDKNGKPAIANLSKLGEYEVFSARAGVSVWRPVGVAPPLASGDLLEVPEFRLRRTDESTRARDIQDAIYKK